MRQTQDQSAVLAFLSEGGGAFPDQAVRVIETHISVVFLVGDLAYKLKRALHLPYLDYATLAVRKRMCEAEIDLNRRAAPALYLGLSAVTRRADGGLALDGDGEPVEWLVRMRRFDPEQGFDRLAEVGGLNRRLMERTAAAIAAFHERAEVTPDFGGLAGLGYIVDNNDECLRGADPGQLDQQQVAALHAASRQALERLSDLLERRRHQGKVRHGHGDLHLRNICLIDDQPVLFDAIEFSDRIACTDVLYDVAFLLMDLDARGHRRLANIAMNAYLSETRELLEDDCGVAALSLMMSVRAGVRAHVGIAAARAKSGEAAEREITGSRHYLTTAVDLLAPTPPRLVAVGGLSGSGKSRMGREVAPYLGNAPGAVIARSDVLRKQLMGVRPLDRLSAEGYSADVTGCTYDALYKVARQVLQSGRSVVADAVFARPEERAAIERVAADVGVPFCGLWLEAAPDVAESRVRHRKGNPSDATVEVLQKQRDYELGTITWARIDSSGPREATLAAGLKALGVET